MKKEKMLVKEIIVLSEVIKEKVNEERKKVLEEKVGKDKGYKVLVKKVEEFNKEIERLKKIEEGLRESVKEINKRLDLEVGKGVGNLGFNGVFSNYGVCNKFSININVNNLYGDKVYNKLMIENIDGDLKVGDLINRMVKEFVKV